MKHTNAFDVSESLGLRAALAVFALGVAASASAVRLEFKIKNNSGVTVNDIELTIAGTGGNITNRVVVDPGGGNIMGSLGNEFKASFNNLANGGSLIGRFDVPDGSIRLDSGNWTFNGNVVGAIDMTQTGITVGNMGGDVEYFKAVPEPGSLMALGLGAAALLRKRRRTA
ncbi:PEP-CTERM sorting domain-containing protein [bacterium]|nr:MAG: PEP-CTERM sorting domain-containing protein [bacterium]